MSEGRAFMNQCRNPLGLFLSVAITVCVLAVGALRGAQAAPSGTHPEHPPNSLRLYVFDCGTLHIEDMRRFQLKKEEVATTDLAVACFLGTGDWNPWSEIPRGSCLIRQ